MIYLQTMDCNLPGSFSPDAKFHPRLADSRCNGKFIIGRILVIGIFAIVPAVPIVWAIFVNPFIAVVEFMIPVTMVFVKSFWVPFDVVLVMDRLVLGTAAVMLRRDALFGAIIAMPVFPAAGPGSPREYKHQRCRHQTDYQKFRFHCLASFVGICLFRRLAGQMGLQKI